MASEVGTDAADAVGSPREDAARERTRRSDGTSGEQASDSGTRPSLSVVVVTYNEEERVETCFDSVFAACRHEPSVEVILVDSNSTDRTVELARQYPLTIVQIPTDDLTTPGAGRYVGQRVATGDQILFVDGDMHLSEEWLRRARRVVADRDDVAGVDGHLNTATASSIEPVEALRGVALYDADALAQVDGFDPFLQALEDVELGYRITREGYEMCRLPEVAAAHPFEPGASEVVRRWRNGYYFGLGQAVRKNLDSPGIVRKLLARHRYPLLFVCWLGVGLTTLAFPPMAVAWVAVSLALFAADAAWEGLANANQRLTKYALMTVGFPWGFLMRPREHAAFPADETVRLQEPEPVEA